MEEKKYLIFNSFVLKILALLTMTIDHVGAAMESFAPWLGSTTIILRSIGRLALPLFIFMIVEGALKTKHIKKYFLRLGIFALIISSALCVFQYVPNRDLNSFAKEGNIFLDLLLSAFLIYSLDNKTVWKKALAIIPIAIGILSIGVKFYERSTPLGQALWYPDFLRMQYDIYAILLAGGYYIAKKISPLFLELFYQVEKGAFTNTDKLQLVENIFSIFFLIAVSLIYYSVHFVKPNVVFWDYKTQNYAMLSSLIILLYNGKRGYNASWFKIGCYIYYPVHILAIIGLFIVIYGY